MLTPFARRVLVRLPFKHKIITQGALLPPALKVNPVYRALHIIKQTSAKQERLMTNLGMDRGLRVSLPWDMPDTYFFGRPTDYHGEVGALRLACALSKYSSAFVDIGSHIGYFIFYLRNVCRLNLPIFFFEPNPELYNLITENVAANHLQNVVGHQYAVGRVSSEATFFLDLSDPLQSSLGGSASAHKVKSLRVQVISLDDWIESASLSNICLKVDAENAEFDVMQGARANIAKISFFIMEVLASALKNHFVEMMIREHGFHAYYLNHLTLEHSSDGNFQYQTGEYNWLFCRQAPAELQAMLMNSGLRIV